MMETNKKNTMNRKRSRGRCPDGSANPIDVYVGQRLNLRRKVLVLSQEALARSIGITFQQIQKYEKGINRISASRLYDFSRILGVDMNYFFQDMPSEISAQSPMNLYRPDSKYNDIFLKTPPELTSEAQQLLSYYFKIHRSDIARIIQELLKSLAQPTSSQN